MAKKTTGTGGLDEKELAKYLKTVTKDGIKLGEVPEEYRTAELCRAAVQHVDWDMVGGFLKYVPEALKAQVKKAAPKKK